MTVSEFFQVLAASATVATAAAGAAGYVVKSLFQQWLNRDIESFKANLQHQLAIARLEHDVTFRRVDEKVAGHLSEVYQRLHTFYECVVFYARYVEYEHEPSPEEKVKAAQTANKECYTYLLKNRPYIPPALFKQTKTLLDKMVDEANNITKGRRRDNMQGADLWTDAYERLNNEVSQLMTEYVGQIQRRLGVQYHPATASTAKA